MRNLIKFLWLGLFLMLVSCGGGGGSKNSTPNTPSTPSTPIVDPGSQYKKSKFYDLPVSGLFYSTDSWSGYTNKAGEFYYLPGEEISFRLAGLELGTVKAGPNISFTNLATDDEGTYTDKIINLVSLFYILDEDSNYENGIQLDSGLIDELSKPSTLKKKKLSSKVAEEYLYVTNDHKGFKNSVDRKLASKNRSLLNREESMKLLRSAEAKSNCPYYYPPIISEGLKNKVSCVDHERAYWLNQYSHHIQKVQIDNPSQSFDTSYGEVEQRTNKIAEYMQLIPSFLEGFEADYKKRLLKEVALSNTDILFTIAKAINADFEIIKPEHVDISYKIIESVIDAKECAQIQGEACTNTVIKILEAYGTSLDDDSINTQLVLTKLLPNIPRIIRLHQLYNFSKEDYLALATASFGTAVTLHSTGGLSSSSNQAIENIATIFSDGAVAFIQCRRGDILKCLSSVSGTMVASVDNIVKAGSVLGVNYIWSDVNQSIEFHEDYRKVMDYLININFDMDVVSKKRGIARASRTLFYENIDYVIDEFVENHWFRDDTSYKYSLRLKIYELFQGRDAFARLAKGVLTVSPKEIKVEVGESFSINATYRGLATDLPSSINRIECDHVEENKQGVSFIEFSPQRKNSRTSDYTITCSVVRKATSTFLLANEEIIFVTVKKSISQANSGSKFLTSPICDKSLIQNNQISLRISGFLKRKQMTWLNNEFSFLKIKGRYKHDGTDMAVVVNTPVVAVMDGVVAKYCNSVSGRRYEGTNTLLVTDHRNTDQICRGGVNGNYVFIKHNDSYLTQYLHLNKVVVKGQQVIKKGQLLGYSGNTGLSGGAHLHFAVKKFSNYVDPFPSSLWDYQDEPQDWIDYQGHIGARSTCGGDASMSNNSAPSKPAHVIASDSNPDYIRVTGYESIGATKYEIYRSTSSTKTSMEMIGGTVKLVYKDMTAVLDKKYFYRVKACNAIDCSKLSDQYDPGIRTQEPSETKPSKPTLKSPGSASSPGTELTDKTPTLSWNPTDRATYYKVAVRDAGTNQLVLNEANVTGTSIVTSTLVTGHKYYWDITACNSVGCAEWSESLYFQIKDTVVIPTLGKAEVLSPGSSTSPGIEITDKTPTMSLKKILNATHYWVKVDNITSGSVVLNDKNVAFTSFPLLTPLTVTHNYKWRAAACNADGCGEWSDFLYFKVVDESQSLPIPSKPRNLLPGSSERDNSVNLDSKNVTLQWSSENNASKYKLSLFDYNTKRYLVENQYITGTSYDASSLVDFGHQYFWDLLACNNNNECSSKERAHFNINGQVIEPDKPTGLSPGTTSRDNPQMLSDTSPTLRWSNANNADWYKVWVIKGNLSSSGAIVTRGVRANSNSYTVDGLLEGSRYWWYVEACNDDACTDSDYYAIEIEAAQMPVPSPPVITNTYILPAAISLTWNDITGVDKYELELTDLEGNDNQNKVVTSTSGGFTNLYSDHRYKIGVRAHNSTGYGDYSYFEFKTKVDVPNAPALIIVKTEGINAFVAWNEITGADQYRVRLYDEDSSFSDSKYVNESPVAFLGLISGHRYKVKIKARVNGVYSEYSDYEYFTIDNIVALCPLRHFTNDKISEYLQKGFSDLQSGVSQVAELQNFLNELGYNAGTADGIFGNGTEQAVKSYQSAKGLFADGKIGSNTRDKINSTSCN